MPEELGFVAKTVLVLKLKFKKEPTGQILLLKQHKIQEATARV
jgi:hypothetical protein